MLVGLDLGGSRPVSLLELVAVVVGYAVAPVIMARRLADLPRVPVVSASLLLVAVGYLPFAASPACRPTVAPETVWSIVVLALVCTALAFVVFFALIAAIGPARATVITYVNPAVAVVLGVLLLDERLTVGMMIGFPLILAGSVLAARKPSGARRGRGARGRRSASRSPTISRCAPIRWAVSNAAATSPAPVVVIVAPGDRDALQRLARRRAEVVVHRLSRRRRSRWRVSRMVLPGADGWCSSSLCHCG